MEWDFVPTAEEVRAAQAASARDGRRKAVEEAMREFSATVKGLNYTKESVDMSIPPDATTYVMAKEVLEAKGYVCEEVTNTSSASDPTEKVMRVRWPLLVAPPAAPARPLARSSPIAIPNHRKFSTALLAAIFTVQSTDTSAYRLGVGRYDGLTIVPMGCETIGLWECANGVLYVECDRTEDVYAIAASSQVASLDLDRRHH